MRYLFFAPTAFFRRGVFSHARVRACEHMRARTHLCNACAFIMGARRTEFQLSTFYDCFAELFHPASSQKAKLRNFRGKTVPKLAKSGKKREIRLETAEKRLFAAMKGRYSSEKTIKRRKPAKKREKRKKRKKLKNFKKRRKNSWQGVYKCGIIVKLTNERTSTAGRTPVKQAD